MSDSDDNKDKKKPLIDLTKHIKKEHVNHPLLQGGAKPQFDQFISSFPKALVYFSQNPNTAKLIDPNDVEAIYSATVKQGLKLFGSYISFTLLGFLTARYLQKAKSKYFNTLPTFEQRAVFYFLAPVLATTFFDTIVLQPQYYRSYEAIQSKYNFEEPFFKEEFEKDPLPVTAVNSYFLKKLHLK